MGARNQDGYRVLVIGLDGGTFDVLHPLVAAGLLPNLGRMMRDGAWGVLRSTVPPHSAPAWSSFATGANPGRHGVYHFRPVDRRFYDGDSSWVVNSRSIALPTIWARASQAGKRVGVINVPLTYPPEPVNGFLVSGMLTPSSASVFTFPPDLSASLSDYVIDARAGAHRDLLERKNLRTPEGIQWLARALDHQLAVRTRTALRLLGQHEPHLAVVVFTETDRLHHFFWPCLDEGREPPPLLQPYTAWTKDFYARLDESVGQLVSQMGEGAVCLVTSDHGFGAYPTRQFYANIWLRDMELLKVRATSVRTAPIRWMSRLGLNRAVLHRLLSLFLPLHRVRSLRIAWGRRMRLPIDWERTQAYYMPLFDFVGGIIINVPENRHAYEEVRETVMQGLRELVDPDTGLRVVREVHCREDLYEGPFVGSAPDVVFALEPKYVGDRSLLTHSWFGKTAAAGRQWTGTHRFEGILLMDGPPIRQGETEPALIQDVAPTVLHLLGLPVPDTMDGRVLVETFSPEYLGSHPVRRVRESPEPLTRREEGEWDEPDDEAQVAERLRALGYLE